MPKALIWTLAVIIALAAFGFGGRAYATRAMSTRAVTPKALGSNTPATAGIPFSRVAVETGDRTLIGWWVRARADTGPVPPALLFLHGNRSSISDYVDLQRFLYRQGVSSMVFDYSGFGASSGSPSLENAIEDAGSVARVFADSAGQTARKIAMGSGLGSTVLLQAIDSVQSHVNGVVVEGVDASVRESAVRSGRLPKFVAPLLPDPADNVEAAARVSVPLLAVHSYDDARVPIDDAQKVVGAVPVQSSLVRHARKGHGSILSSSRPCDWEPVLLFVRAGTLPQAKMDSTDACAAEAAADSAKQVPAPAGDTVAPTGTQRPPAAKQGASKAPTRSPTKTPATARPN